MTISQLLNKWMGFYKEWYNNTNFKGWFKSVVDEHKTTLHNLIYRSKNLSQVNFELGIYHLKSGATNDAILRFNIVKLLNSSYPNVCYYLGLCYYEKYNYNKSKLFFTKHLEGNPKDFKEETNFCLNIINNQIDKITYIPKSLIKNTFDQLAPIFNQAFIDNQPSTPQQALFSATNQMLIEKGKPFGNNILDIGAGTGILGKFCRVNKIANLIIGVDISSQMVAISNSLTHEGLKVYNNIENTDAEAFISKYLADKGDKFDVTFASNFLTYNPDLDWFFQNTFELTKADGLLGITFKISQNKDTEFNAKFEQFYFSPSYVKAQAEKSKWKLSKEISVNFPSKEEGRIYIFNK